MEIDILKEFTKAQKGMKGINPNYIKNDLYLIHKYIMELKENAKDNVDTRYMIAEELGQIIIDYLDVCGTGTMQIQENAMQILSSNPVIVDRIYDKVKDKKLTREDIEKEGYKIRQGEEQSLEFEVEAMLQELREGKLEGEIKKYAEIMVNPKDEEARKEIKANMDKDPEFKEVYEYTKILIESSERKQLEMYIQHRKKDLEKKLFNLEKECLKISGRFLKKYGFLQEELEQQNRDYKSLSLGGMQYKIRTEDSEEDVGLENIFEDKYLDTLSLEEITVLNAFWQNRFTKKIERN